VTNEAVDVLLGGGLLESGDPRLLEAIAAGLRDVGPPTNVRTVDAPPVLGSALAALDLLNAAPEAYESIRLRLSEPAAAVPEGR
jgi:hypothetical protein